MSRVTCRCGEVITITAHPDQERIDCPRCGSRIRLRRRPSASGMAGGDNDLDDGYIRFYCPCGRRLKVRAAGGQEEGKCPDCGRVVPVPDRPPSKPKPGGPRVDPDARTEDLDAADLALLDEWSTRHTGRAPGVPGGEDATPTAVPGIRVMAPPSPAGGPAPSMATFEAGLRVCPRCGKPVHIERHHLSRLRRGRPAP